MPKICNELQCAIASGNLVTKSDFLLVRYQDRLIVVHILERGYKYCTLIARGLELQETSCHTVEAARVDDIFEDVFTKDRTSTFGFNPYPLHTLTPLNCLVVETYSDAHNVLTGVIDQPENIGRQSTNFMKCLVWVLLNHQKCKKGNDRNENSVVENHEAFDTTEVTELKDDHMALQNTQTTLCDLPSEENLRSLPVQGNTEDCYCCIDYVISARAFSFYLSATSTSVTCENSNIWYSGFFSCSNTAWANK